jgi:hypothetical protein
VADPAFRPIVSVPSLDEIAERPEVFDALPPATQAALLERAEVLAARLRAKVLAARRSAAPLAAAPDRAVRIDEAVTLLGLSKDYLYRHKSAFSGYREGGHVLFPLSAIQRHLRQTRRGAAP